MKKILFLFVVLLIGCENTEELNSKAAQVGEYLLDSVSSGGLERTGSGDHPGIVSLNKNLQSKLISLKPTFNASCGTVVNTGDVRGELGDGAATHHMYITCDNEKIIGIRLKYDSEEESFHILGYWTSGL